MVERVLVFATHGFSGRELKYLDPVQGPAVGRRTRMQLGGGLRERHIECHFAAPLPLQQKVHRHRGFAGAGVAFDEVHPIRRKAARQERIEAFDAR